MAQDFLENSYLYGANAAFIEELYARYVANPASVDASWQRFFASLGDAPARQIPWNQVPVGVIGQPDPDAPAAKADKKNGAATPAAPALDAAAIQDEALNALRAQQLIRAYRVRGHLLATLDPLGIETPTLHADLDPVTYGFSADDYGRSIYLGGNLGRERATLREILDILQATYSGTFGVEFMHIQDPAQRQWVQQRIEAAAGNPQFSADEKKGILRTLLEVEAFEEFVQVKYTGMKRFSIQGGDAMVPGLVAILETASNVGVDEIVIGMPHRGRMNVLTSIMGKPYSELLSIFNGNLDFPDNIDSSGDVKYHLGASHDRTMANGKKMHLSLTANPSHLEIVNPVVVGKVRAKQDQRNDADRNKVMALTLHGDAAFAGQGSVPETLSLAELRGYRTGGTVHVVVNNQIGFTTAPKYSRFTPYPTDVAKMIQAPIFHANGDNPEAVVFCCQLATEFRQAFGRDAVVDVICYRKYGHNEGDEPMYTQPLMYKIISKKPLPAHIYGQRLIAQGVISEAEIAGEVEALNQHFNKEYEAGKAFKPNKANWLEGKWSGFTKAENGLGKEPDTGVDIEKLAQLGMKLTVVPEGFHIIRQLERILKRKQEMLQAGEGLDWGMGEALAFASLVAEGVAVRLTGQDSGRGTFSHRNSVWVDQETEERHVPLNHVAEGQARYEVHDSSLSELAVLGFEYGYSLAEPSALTLWEGQFGDFANGAQMVIDQFIASGENKWLRMSGLVMLLPHGYEGQGPEHSSARLERFLQLCGEDNMQVANITTPANLFHALRRQMRRNFRKPLVVMTPKSLLRHKLCVSTLADFAPGTRFQRVIGETDTLAKDGNVKRVIFTSGKLYYDLLEARREKAIDDIALVRVEQYYPFPASEIEATLKKYPNAQVAWAQEEPENMGAWRFIGPRIGEVMDALGRTPPRIQYIGRKEAASPAAGYMNLHQREQAQVIADAMTLEAATVKQKKKA
ncbi:MAG: 2-oxoglutarate dehydrogenase E1 component [Alphaproteobacteria bacterium]|nr:2-oxoglutarate dehydrogenase E1 component [Alphaproteobacteria bacterium]